MSEKKYGLVSFFTNRYSNETYDTHRKIRYLVIICFVLLGVTLTAFLSPNSSSNVLVYSALIIFYLIVLLLIKTGYHKVALNIFLVGVITLDSLFFFIPQDSRAIEKANEFYQEQLKEFASTHHDAITSLLATNPKDKVIDGILSLEGYDVLLQSKTATKPLTLADSSAMFTIAMVYIYLLVIITLVVSTTRQLLIFSGICILLEVVYFLYLTLFMKLITPTPVQIGLLVIAVMITLTSGIFLTMGFRNMRSLFQKIGDESSLNKQRYDQLRNLIIKGSDGLQIGKELISSSERSISDIQEINESLEGAKIMLDLLNNDIKSLSNNGDRINALSNDIQSLTDEHAAAISQSSASIEEVTASIRQISDITQTKKTYISDLSAIAQASETEMQHSKEQMEFISTQASEMLDIINVIVSISSQTNLLAMNAAIEAAHAGDAGKGFAVVADEIRKLAEETSKNTKSITENLKSFNENIIEATSINTNAAESFNRITKDIKDVLLSYDEIDQGIQEISTTTSEILKAITSIVQKSSVINESIERMQELLKMNNARIENISAKAGEIDERNGVILKDFQKIQEESQNIKHIGNQNIKHIKAQEDELNSITETGLTLYEGVDH